LDHRDKLDWVIAGGESGPGARPAKLEWFRSVRDQCAEAGVPFFFKQWGGRTRNRQLDGIEHNDFPVARHMLRIATCACGWFYVCGEGWFESPAKLEHETIDP